MCLLYEVFLGLQAKTTCFVHLGLLLKVRMKCKTQEAGVWVAGVHESDIYTHINN